MIERFIDWTERGLVPDSIVRMGIRRLLVERLKKVDLGSEAANERRLDKLTTQFSEGPIALVPEKANEQHYEVPAALFDLTLGPRRKYSCCYWPEEVANLADAESLALAVTCGRAQIEDGMDVLELGCGWGSLSLWIAEKYPSVKLTSVSNSSSQKEFILQEAQRKNIGDNLTVISCDMNNFSIDKKFDRVVSVEMFEHMRNYQRLLARVSSWLKPKGKLFVHIFCHRKLTYEFQDESGSDWMSRYFFSGGIMPGDGLLERFQEDLKLEQRWRWNGQHYQRTCEAWLSNMDRNRQKIMPILEATYGQNDATRWFYRWRMFYLACSELFGYRKGNEWWVGHYLFGQGAGEGSSQQSVEPSRTTPISN